MLLLTPEINKKKKERKVEFLLDLKAKKPRKNKTVWSTEHLNTEGAVKLLTWKKATAEVRDKG